MNNKMCSIVIGLLVFLASCDQFGRGACGNRHVTANHNAKKIVPRPEHVSMCRGDILTIGFKPEVAQGTGHAAPDPEKNPEATWLSGSNEESNDIILIVGEDAKLDYPYKYSITIDGVGTVDPRVTVMK
jgi:hypothetical protein